MNFVVDIYDHTGKHLQSVLFHKLRDAIALAQCHNESIKVIVKNRQSEEVVHMKLYGEAGRWSPTNAEVKGKASEA